MSQPDSNQNEPSKMKNLINGGTGESPLSRLPRGKGGGAPKKEVPSQSEESEKPVVSPKPVKQKTVLKTTAAKTNYSGNRFLPTFWTIASAISMLVNIVVVIALIVIIRLLGGTKSA